MWYNFIFDDFSFSKTDSQKVAGIKEMAKIVNAAYFGLARIQVQGSRGEEVLCRTNPEVMMCFLPLLLRDKVFVSVSRNVSGYYSSCKMGSVLYQPLFCWYCFEWDGEHSFVVTTFIYQLLLTRTKQKKENKIRNKKKKDQRSSFIQANFH